MLSSAYPVHGSVSKVNCSGADAQVVSCHGYLVVFHPFVEQLTIFHISELVQATFFILESSTLTASGKFRHGTCHFALDTQVFIKINNVYGKSKRPDGTRFVFM